MSKGLEGQESDLFLGEHHSMLPSLGTRPKEKNIDSLFSGGKMTALVNTMAGLDDFELVTFLLIQPA